MSKNDFKTKKEKDGGSILLATIVVIAIILVIALSNAHIVLNNTKMSEDWVSSQQSFNVAESGTEIGLMDTGGGCALGSGGFQEFTLPPPYDKIKFGYEKLSNSLLSRGSAGGVRRDLGRSALTNLGNVKIYESLNIVDLIEKDDIRKLVPVIRQECCDKYGQPFNVTTYEPSDTIQVAETCNGLNKGLNKEAGTYNPNEGKVPVFQNFTIENGGNLTTTSVVPIEIIVKGTLEIKAGGRISADGQGWSGSLGVAHNSFGIGRGQSGEDNWWSPGGAGGGGGNGGQGGGKECQTLHDKYGNPYESCLPNGAGGGGRIYNNYPEYGSGGGKGGRGQRPTQGGGCGIDGGVGGAGGGLITIRANKIILNGNISADGAGGGNSHSDFCGTGGGGGGGSGGVIYIFSEFAFNVLGTSSITARGGHGGTVSGLNMPGGGGGGGRIIIKSPSVNGTLDSADDNINDVSLSGGQGLNAKNGLYSFTPFN